MCANRFVLLTRFATFLSCLVDILKPQSLIYSYKYLSGVYTVKIKKTKKKANGTHPNSYSPRNGLNFTYLFQEAL